MSKPPQREPDPHTLERFRNGDLSALAAVFELYGAPILQLARKMMGNQDDAEDATQEIFLRAFEQAGKFEGRSGLYTWLYRLAVRHCLNLIRQRQRRRHHEGSDTLKRHCASRRPAPSPMDRLQREEQAGLVDRLLQSLPPEYRACLVLREMEGLTYAQIAEHLDIPAGTVMSRLSRGRQVLRERLRASKEDPKSPGIEPGDRLSKTSEEP